MFYSVRHTTRFRYSKPISESVMEVRKQPRSEGNQRCFSYELSVNPRARIMDYQDHVGNIIQHFDIPGHHTQVTVRAKSLVEVVSLPPLPASLPASTWNELDDMVEKGDYWEMLLPSHFARPTRRLSDLASELNLRRRDDPLTLLKGLNTALYDRFTYMPESTRVDSPIDDALQARRGVCQDFAHIMIALVRGLRIPCRYVSGYLFHRDHYRSTRDATHAWVEALLPGLGWIGFDPTNNLLAGEQHIRVAIGRDYADVPPTRGIYKGDAKNELSVAVQVALSDAPLPEEVLPARGEWLPLDSEEQAQQQQ